MIYTAVWKISGLFLFPFSKKEVIFIPDKKSLDQLRLEKGQAELRLVQERHRLTRLENRKQYYKKGERAKRTHELCTIGRTVKSLAPVFKGLPKQEMYELLETVFSLTEVQHTLRSFASRKEDAEHGSVPFHSRPDETQRRQLRCSFCRLPFRKKLHSAYYGEVSDYTRKIGIIWHQAVQLKIYKLF